MLRYSELSKPQKAIIDEMKKGHILKLTPAGYIQCDGRNTVKVNANIANALGLRHFIIECFYDKEKNIREYCLNADITY